MRVLTKNWLHSIVLIVLALGALTLNFVFEEPEPGVVFEEESFGSDFVWRFAGESELKDFDQPPSKKDRKVYTYNVEKPLKTWFYGENSFDTFVLNFGDVQLWPRLAVFSLDYDGENIELEVVSGNVELRFSAEEESGRLLIASGRKVNIPLNKLDKDLADLLRKKLEKEFRYGLVPQSFFQESWAKENLVKDDLWREEFLGSLRERFQQSEGPKSGFFFELQKLLTFTPEKERRLYMTNLFASLDLSLAQALNDGDVRNGLDQYLAFLNEVDDKDFVAAKREKLLEDLLLYVPGDKEYEVFEFLWSQSFNEADFDGKRFYLSLLLQDVYQALVLDRVEDAKEALIAYFDAYKLTLRAAGDLNAVEFLEDQNALIYALLIDHSEFHQDVIFEIKSTIEADLLALYPAGDLQIEVAQSLISEKLDLMKRLRFFFFEDLVAVPEAKEIYKRLMNEVKDLMPQGGEGGAAVLKLFEEQLSDVEDFWGYLRSPSYHSAGAGFTHKDRYQGYLNDRAAVVNLNSLREEIFGEVADGEETVYEVQEEVESALSEYPEVTDLEIGELEDLEARYVPLSLVIGGYPVQANFDRYSQNLQDVYVYEELVASRPLKVDGLLSVLEERFAELEDDAELGLEDGGVESIARRSARLFVAKKIEEFGFVITLENVAVFDEANALYRVQKIYLSEDEDQKVVITFDVNMTKEVALNVLMNVDGEVKAYNEEMDFESLRALVAEELSFLQRSSGRGVIRR